jgi:hypothetical protein
MTRLVSLRRFALATLALLLMPTIRTAAAQSPSPQAAPAAAPAANPADVASVDAILAALYASISGPAGAERDWPRFRTLMAPGARLMPTGRTAQGERRMRVWTAEEYITAASPGLMRNGFYEREIGRTMERYGNIVHVMSAYDSKNKLEDPAPFQRGINSIQLWNDGTRWWIVSIFWEAETPANPIPAGMLRTP